MNEVANVLTVISVIVLPCVLQILLCRYVKSVLVRLVPIIAVGGFWLLSVLDGLNMVDLFQLPSLTTAIHIDMIDLFPIAGIPILISIGIGWLISYLINEVKDEG